MSDAPTFVSIVVPVRNEARFIAGLLESLLSQDYPADLYEIIVADGMSTDGTRDILSALQAQHTKVIVIDNPDRIVPTGLNLALARSRGEVIIRVDGHALIAPDFIRQNVALLHEHPEAWCVGGPIRHVANGTFGKAAAVAMSHPLGVGNARHHYPGYTGYVDGTAFPAIRRWVFERIGTFDERLVRNQDDEFNYRLGRAGGRVYVSPRVRYTYYVRETVGQLFRQYTQYGFWRIPVIEKHRRPTTMRQLAPVLFFGLCALLAAAGLLFRSGTVALALPSAYAAALILGAASTIRHSGWRVSACVPLAIATMHAGYALGTASGLWARFFRPGAWDARGKMAAISR